MTVRKEKTGMMVREVTVTKGDVVEENHLFFNVVRDKAGRVYVVLRDTSKKDTQMVISADILCKMIDIVHGVMDSHSNVGRHNNTLH